MLIIFIFSAPVLLLFSSGAKVLQIAEKAPLSNTAAFFTFEFQFAYSTLYLTLARAIGGGFLSISRQGIFFIATYID